MAVIFVFLLTFAASAGLAESAGPKEPPLNPASYGEKNFEHYYGPFEPEFRKDGRYGRVVFEAGERQEKRFYDLSEWELLHMENFFKDFEAARVCPNSVFAKHFEYIRYLYRLTALSYLRESLARLDDASQKMKFGDICKVDLPELLKECSPKGADMKLFVKSAKVLSKNFDRPAAAFDFPFEEHLKEWTGQFHKGKLKEPSQKRLYSYCEKNSKNCKRLGAQGIKKAFKEICRQDSRTFIKICSEKDALYGMSGVNQPFHVISSSDALKAINEEGRGRGCLARFSSLMRDKEVREEALEKVFPGIYEQLRKEGPFAQTGGKLFPAGSLKIFMKNGLEEIFVEKPKLAKASKEKVEEKEEPEIELAPLAPEPLKKIFKPKPKSPKKTASVPEPAPKPKPKKSHFLSSSEARKEFKLETVKLDMLKFKYDYVFTPKMFDFLEAEVSKFATRKGLEEMKEFDSLGTKKGPVPLLFIKYLIEENNHQGLFNLVEVVGEEFFVKNNIDPPELREPYNYVRLKFEEEADFKWQLLIKEEPSTSGRE